MGRIVVMELLDRRLRAHLEALQQEGGGWVVDFPATSPMGALDWRAYATVRAVDVLRMAGRVPTDERRLVSAS